MPFSILERIVVVETHRWPSFQQCVFSFSILERIVVVETSQRSRSAARVALPFSILERIVVVETYAALEDHGAVILFQYPRTDRGG